MKINAALLLWLLCSNVTASDRVYTVGIIPYIPAGEFVVADVKGFYKAEGLKVKSIYYSSTGDWIRAMSNGKLNFASVWNATQVDMYYRGSTAKRLAVMFYDKNDYKMVVRKGSSPKSLKGKPIAVFADYFGTHWFIQNHMSKGGLSVHDVRVVEMNNHVAYKNFKIGRVDGMVFDGKYMNLSIKEKYGELADLDKNLYRIATAAGPSYFEDNGKIPKEDLKKFLRAWIKTKIWIGKKENANEYKMILRKAFHNVLDLVGIETDAEYEAKKPREMLIPLSELRSVNKSMPDMFDRLIKIRNEIGYKNDRKYQPEKMFDSSLVLEVLKEMKL